MSAISVANRRIGDSGISMERDAILRMLGLDGHTAQPWHFGEQDEPNVDFDAVYREGVAASGASLLTTLPTI
jgi:hypothetical protein